MSRRAVRYRAIDLARLAGISAQQIRNYADAGILPPVPRSDAGYRLFDSGHEEALLAYRALMAGCGPHRAREIMHAVNAGEVSRALGLLDAGHAALHEQRRSASAVAEALERVSAQPPRVPSPPGGRMLVGEVATYLGVRTSALRTWESAGLLSPARERGTDYRRYGPADVRDAQVIRMLRQSHYLLHQIRPVLDDLRATGSTVALRDAVAERRARLTERSRALLAAAGHLHRYIREPSPSMETETETGAGAGRGTGAGTVRSGPGTVSHS